MSSNPTEEQPLSLDTIAIDLLNEQPTIHPTSSDKMSPMSLNTDIKLDDEKLFEIKSASIPKPMLSPLHRVQISNTFKPGLEAFSGSISVSQTLSIHRQIDKKYQQTIYSSDDLEKPFELIDVLSNMQSSMSSILENDFSLCFKRPEHRPWNWNYFLFFFWIIGVFIRYCILFPLRLIIYCSALALTSVQFWVIRKVFRNDPQKRKEWEV